MNLKKIIKEESFYYKNNRRVVRYLIEDKQVKWCYGGTEIQVPNHLYLELEDEYQEEEIRIAKKKFENAKYVSNIIVRKNKRLFNPTIS